MRNTAEVRAGIEAVVAQLLESSATNKANGRLVEAVREEQMAQVISEYHFLMENGFKALQSTIKILESR